MTYHLVIVGFGNLIGYKYMGCIKDAHSQSLIDGYSVIELESQKELVQHRVDKVDLKPENVFYLSDKTYNNKWADRKDLHAVFEKIKKEKKHLKVFIATEVKAHEVYLRYCIDNNIDSMTEKPIFAPMKKGRFDPSSINRTMSSLVKSANQSLASHTIMTLSRYHAVYNDELLNAIRAKVLKLGAPLTSLHILSNYGVWNLYKEYESRDDHPYKDGYGMLMHGAYHYIDLMAQFLSLNKLIYKDDDFVLTLSSFVCYPSDQSARIPKIFNDYFNDKVPKWAKNPKNSIYGETDTTTSFSLVSKKSGKTITLGTISLEQTTPSLRSWKNIENYIYNKNGRLPAVIIEAQLSTLFSASAHLYKAPVLRKGKIKKLDIIAQVTSRANANLLKDEQYIKTKKLKNYSNSSQKLMMLWLQDKENKSRIQEHVNTMRILQALAESINKPGYPVSTELT